MTARNEDLVLLPNQAMRARRRPGAVAALWAWEGALAFCLGWPIASTVAAFYGGHPDGDAPLWAAGSFPLMSLGVRARTAAPSVSAHVAILLTLALVVGIWSTAAVLASVAYTTRDLRAPTLRQALGAGMAAFRASGMVFVALSLVQLSLVASGWALGDALDNSLYFKVGEARAEQLGWAVAGVFLALACLVGVVQEAARAAVVRYRIGPGSAIRLGLLALRRAPVRLPWSWAWRAMASVVPIAFGSLVAERLGGRGGLALWALLGVHQAVVIARVALRTSWLARAMRAVDAAG